MLQIELTQINDEGFDPAVTGYDLDAFRHYHVAEIVESIDEGHLVYRKVNVTPCDPTDPTTNILLAGSFKRRNVAEERDEEVPRVVWDGKLWRVSDADQLIITALLYGHDLGELRAKSELVGKWWASMTPNTLAELADRLRDNIIETVNVDSFSEWQNEQ